MSNYHPNCKNSCSSSYKAIKLSPHAKQRAYERASITTETELKKKANLARLNGVNVQTLSPTNMQGLPQDWVRYLKNHYGVHTNHQRVFYHNQFVYIFAGKGSKTLITFIPCTEEDVQQAIKKMDRRKE